MRDGVVTDPPTAERIAAIRADIEAALDLAERDRPAGARRAPSSAWPARSPRSRRSRWTCPSTTPAAIHHSRVSRDRVREITERLLRSTHAERAAVPAMHPGRVDVIAAGALVLLAIMERTGAAEVVVSEHDILDGIAWSGLTARR